MAVAPNTVSVPILFPFGGEDRRPQEMTRRKEKVSSGLQSLGKAGGSWQLHSEPHLGHGSLPPCHLDTEPGHPVPLPTCPALYPPESAPEHSSTFSSLHCWKETQPQGLDNTDTHTYILTHTHTLMFAYSHIHILIFTHSYTHKLTHTCPMCSLIHVHTIMHSFTHTYTCILMHIHSFTHSQTHSHMFTQVNM